MKRRMSNIAISTLIQLILIEPLYFVKYHARCCDGHEDELGFKEHVLTAKIRQSIILMQNADRANGNSRG